MNYVKEVEKIEQKIAHWKGKLEFHFKKWNPIKHLLQYFSSLYTLYTPGHIGRGWGDGRIGELG